MRTHVGLKYPFLSCLKKSVQRSIHLVTGGESLGDIAAVKCPNDSCVVGKADTNEAFIHKIVWTDIHMVEIGPRAGSHHNLVPGCGLTEQQKFSASRNKW